MCAKSYKHSFALALMYFTGTISAVGQPSYKPSVNVMALQHSYVEGATSIRQVDFRNMQFVIFEGEKSCTSFQLKDGSIKVQTRFGGDAFSVDQVYYFQAAKDQPERALVELTRDSYGGSSSRGAYLQIFEISHLETLTMTQQISYDFQAPGTGAEFDSTTGTLTVRARSNDDSPHCCPEGTDVVTFQWDGKHFVEKSHRTIPVERK